MFKSKKHRTARIVVDATSLLGFGTARRHQELKMRRIATIDLILRSLRRDFDSRTALWMDGSLLVERDSTGRLRRLDARSFLPHLVEMGSCEVEVLVA